MSRMVTGSPAMARKRPSKSERWKGSSLARFGPLIVSLGQDHLLDERQSLRLEEHVLGAAQADPLAPRCGHAGHPRVVGIGPTLLSGENGPPTRGA